MLNSTRELAIPTPDSIFEPRGQPQSLLQLAAYSKNLQSLLQLCLTTIQLGYDFLLFEKPFDCPKISLRS
jgi:hypothetical protein